MVLCKLYHRFGFTTLGSLTRLCLVVPKPWYYLHNTRHQLKIYELHVSITYQSKQKKITTIQEKETTHWKSYKRGSCNCRVVQESEALEHSIERTRITFIRNENNSRYDHEKSSIVYMLQTFHGSNIVHFQNSRSMTYFLSLWPFDIFETLKKDPLKLCTMIEICKCEIL